MVANCLLQNIRSFGHCYTPPLRLIALGYFLLFLLLFPEHSESVAIDNGIAAPPDVECLDDRIRVWVHTRKLFAGRIYAKGRAEYQACVQTGYAPLRTTKPHYEIPFGQCGMQGLRSIDPRGMYYAVTIMVSFHPLIVTKVDQAFHVKCFFEEANRGLTAELGVSMIPTTEVGAHHGIPGCTYSMHSGTIQQVDGGYLAPPIQHARVGDKILHRWECNDNMYGVLINNCYVTDGFGARAEVVDARGCPIDPILITGIRYARNLTTAFAESHVFKFADKPGVWFFCQIQMCMKGAGMCNGITPPQCSNIPSTTNTGYGGIPHTNAPNIFGPGTLPEGGGYLSHGGQQYPAAAIEENQFDVTATYSSDIPINVIFEQNDNQGVSFEDPTIPDGGNFEDDNSLGYTDYFIQKDSPTGFTKKASTTLSENDLANTVNVDNDGQVFASPTRTPKEFPKNLQFAEEDLKFLRESQLDIGGHDRRFSDDSINYVTSSPEMKKDSKKKMEKKKMRDKMDTATTIKSQADSRTKEPSKPTKLSKAVGSVGKSSPEEEMSDFPDPGRVSVNSTAPRLDDDGKDKEDEADTENMENPEPQEIAGQLLIYDVDEDPPSYFQRSHSSLDTQNSTYDEWDEAFLPGGRGPDGSTPMRVEECPITTKNLLSLISVLVGISAFLFFVLFGTCLKLRSRPKMKKSSEGGAGSTATVKQKYHPHPQKNLGAYDIQGPGGKSSHNRSHNPDHSTRPRSSNPYRNMER